MHTRHIYSLNYEQPTEHSALESSAVPRAPSAYCQLWLVSPVDSTHGAFVFPSDLAVVRCVGSETQRGERRGGLAAQPEIGRGDVFPSLYAQMALALTDFG